MTALGVVDEAGLTQTGHVRRNNEDSYLIRGDLFMIADGMGGAAAGEVASAMCAQAFAEIDLIRSRGEGALRDAIVVANTRIHERAATDPEAAGMGTTVTAALVENGRVALANVGDSRAYLLREGALRRLTEDHSVVAELVATGQISDWEASSHPQRNVVTRVLGAEATVQVDTFWLEAQEGDLVLLCSDGLTDMVPEEEFAKLLAADKSCEQIARDLVRAALAQGGEDNVTTVLFRIGPSREQDAAQPRTVLTQDPDLEPADEGGGRSTRRTVLRILTTVGVIAILGAGSIYFLRWAHFVGADESSGHVAVYQGLPIDLFGGVNLYHEVSDTHIPYAALDQATRKKLFDHTIRSDASARSVAESAGSSGP